MPASAPFRPNTGGNPAAEYALSLKVWSGEMLAEYDKKITILDKVMNKTLPPGAESVQFQVFGNLTADYHTFGDNVIEDGTYLKTLAKGERLIYPDKEVVCPILLSKVQERIAAPEWRAPIARKMAHTLLKVQEQNVFRSLYQAADTAANVAYDGAKAGGGVTTLDLDTPAKLLTALLGYQENFDTNDVPEEDRYVALPPSIYMLMFSDDTFRDYIDRDYQPMMVNGQLAESKIFRVCGFEIIKTNNIPGAGITTNVLKTGKGNDYSVDMSNVQLVAFQSEAVGTVKASDITLEVDREASYRGDLVQASFVSGHGPLRPECAGVHKSS